MSYPNIPNITPSIELTKEDAVHLLLASIALEELGLAHIINAEAEKIQYVLGTLEGQTPPQPPTIGDLLKINRSVQHILRSVIQKQMLLQFKLEDTIDILSQSTSTTTTTTTTSTSTTCTTTTQDCPFQHEYIIDIKSEPDNT